MNRKPDSDVIRLVYLYAILVCWKTLAFGLDAREFTDIQQNFLQPPMDCRPHTYWFWPGNAVTRDEISWELRQMHEQGMGGRVDQQRFFAHL